MRLIIQKTAPYSHRSGEINRQALPLAPHHVLASPRKRVRFCCSVKPSQLWWGLLPIRTINEIFRTIPITKLASLVKGRWIDGKAQTVVLLRFNCDTSAFLFTKLLCRQDGGIALHPPSLSIPTTFSKAHQPFRPTPCPCLPCQREVD